MLNTSEHRRPADIISGMGFRRIEQLRVTVGSGCASAEVTAVTHRYPRTFRISLASAARLAEAGVPLRVERGPAATQHQEKR